MHSLFFSDPGALGYRQPKDEGSSKASTIGMLVFGGFLFLIILLISAVLYHRKKKYGGFYILTLPPPPDYIKKLDPERSLLEQTNKLPYDAQWEFPRERIQMGGYNEHLLLYVGVTISILIGYKHAANSCWLCFRYVIPTDNSFYTCRSDVIHTDNSFMHAEVTSPNTLNSSLSNFVIAAPTSRFATLSAEDLDLLLDDKDVN